MEAQETVDVNAIKKEIDSLKQELKDMAKLIVNYYKTKILVSNTILF